MSIPAGFQISQSSLQDFVDCKRRFQLRYITRLAWPAVEAEPVAEHERYLRLGSEFHYLIHQHHSGLPLERLSATIPSIQGAVGDELSTWWENYLASPYQSYRIDETQPDIPPTEARIYTEFSLSIPIQDFRLIAKYDMLLILPSGQATIIDWKTSHQRPQRRWLQTRLQTRIYPYVLSMAGQSLHNVFQIQPEQIEMCYWFANFPDNPECFQYSSELSMIDRSYLHGLIEQIVRHGDEDFSQTHNEMHCRYCAYRSLCNRGVTAGSLEDNESDERNGGIEFDFDHIEEIDY
mgnify:FL=1